MNFDNLQHGQYVDITYRAGKTKKLITVKIYVFLVILKIVIIYRFPKV